MLTKNGRISCQSTHLFLVAHLLGLINQITAGYYHLFTPHYEYGRMLQLSFQSELSAM